MLLFCNVIVLDLILAVSKLSNNAIFVFDLSDIQRRNLQPGLLQHTLFDISICSVILEPGYIHILQRELHTDLLGVDFTLGKQDDRFDVNQLMG